MIYLISLFMWSEPRLVTELREDDIAKEIVIAQPVDAVFYDDQLFFIDTKLNKLVIYHPKGKSWTHIGRKGNGPDEFHHWPAQLRIHNNEVVVYEWNKLGVHRFSLTGQHIDSQRQGPDAKHLFEKNGIVLKRLSVAQAVEFNRLWSLQGTEHNLGSLPGQKEVFYNFLSGWSLIDIGEDHTIGIMKRDGELELFEDEKLIGTVRFPLELLKKEFVIDKFRSGFYGATGVKEKNAWLNGTPVLGFAMKDKDHLWVLARDEHFNESHRGENEVWLYTFDNGQIGKQKLDKSFEHIRYSFGYLCLISEHDAAIRVLSVD